MLKEIKELSAEVEIAKGHAEVERPRAKGLLNELTPEQKRVVVAGLKLAIRAVKIFCFTKNRNSIIGTLLGIIEQLIPES